MKLPMLPKDKANHLIYGLLVFAISYSILGLITAIIISVCVGIGKELYDCLHKEKHTPDIYDAVVTILGSFIAYLITLL